MNSSISILGVVVFRVAEIGEPLKLGQHLGQAPNCAGVSSVAAARDADRHGVFDHSVRHRPHLPRYSTITFRPS